METLGVRKKQGIQTENQQQLGILGVIKASPCHEVGTRLLPHCIDGSYSLNAASLLTVASLLRDYLT